MGRSLLELGGNNAIIVDETADLKLAIPAIVFGAVGTAGQRCTSTRRLFVHESIYDNVLNTLVTAYKQVEKKIGDPTLADHADGTAQQSRSPCSATPARSTRPRRPAARSLTGGKALTDRPGNFVLPTIIAGLKNSDEIVQTRNVRADPLRDAVQVDRRRHRRSRTACRRASRRRSSRRTSRRPKRSCRRAGSDCGIANVNIGTSGAEIGGAFGGEKETGGGRESGSDAWKAYMRRQTNTINYSDALPLAQGIKFEF